MDILLIAISNPERWCCESAAINMPANLENSAVATGLKKEFSFQSQRKAMPKNAQTTAQLHSSHTLVDFPGGTPRFDPWVGKISWRRKWLPTPVFLPGKSHEWRSLAGCSPWGRKESRLSDFTFTHWRRKWQPTPVFLPGESQGRGSLVGCHLWGRTELDTTEAI